MILKDSEIKNKQDLTGKTLFAYSYTTVVNWINDNVDNCTLITEDNYSNISPEELLELGKIDAFIIDNSYLQIIEKKSTKFRVLDEKFTEEYIAIAVNKNNVELLNMINKSINQMKTSGELERFSNRFDE